ncbi:MAG: hypothetical protein E7667_03765 [Ruminococcaceae bacterium]|nr:hypothetical protein [Oscillospiraceae bacterium]
MTLTERCAYIKGLAEGLDFDKKDTAEAKLIKALIDLCTEMAEEIDDVEYDIAELADYCEELDEDLGDVEEVLLDLDDEDDDWECDGDCDCCDMCDECEDCDDCELYDEEYYEIVCPSCGETVCFDESVNAEELACPACGATLGCIVEDDDVNTVE